MNGESPDMYSIDSTLVPKAVSAHFRSKQILPFAFADWYSDQENPGSIRKNMMYRYDLEKS